MSIFKRFVSYYKPYRFLFYMDLFCALIVSAIDLSFPLILSYLINNVFTVGKEKIINIILVVGMALLAMYVLKYFCQYFIVSYGHIMGAKMETDMRRDMFNHLQKLSFAYYDKHNTGEIMSRLVADLFDIPSWLITVRRTFLFRLSKSLAPL